MFEILSDVPLWIPVILSLALFLFSLIPNQAKGVHVFIMGHILGLLFIWLKLAIVALFLWSGCGFGAFSVVVIAIGWPLVVVLSIKEYKKSKWLGVAYVIVAFLLAFLFFYFFEPGCHPSTII